MTTPAARGWRALLPAALAIVLLSSAGSAQTAKPKPKPKPWSQARLVGTWTR